MTHHDDERFGVGAGRVRRSGSPRLGIPSTLALAHVAAMVAVCFATHLYDEFTTVYDHRTVTGLAFWAFKLVQTAIYAVLYVVLGLPFSILPALGAGLLLKRGPWAGSAIFAISLGAGAPYGALVGLLFEGGVVPFTAMGLIAGFCYAAVIRRAYARPRGWPAWRTSA